MANRTKIAEETEENIIYLKNSKHRFVMSVILIQSKAPNLFLSCLFQ